MTLLCIGDSNTYGYDPRSYFGDRYPADVRWTERLGTWKTVNCGMNGLAVPFNHTVFTDLIRSKSPDVVAVMLGTNDLLEGANAEMTAKRMEAFLTDIKDICPKLLLIVPPPMQPGEWVQSQKQIDESVKLGQEYCELAKKLEIYYADAGEWHAELAYDGVHFTPKGHKAFAEGLVTREEMFITSKVWVTDMGDYEHAKKAVDRSLETCGLEYFDLYLLHQAMGDYFAAWRALEDAYEEGKVRAIGISNFYPFVVVNFCEHVRILPMLNQIETHPFYTQEPALKVMRDYGIVPQAWAPLGSGLYDIFSNELLKGIAGKYGKTVGQVVLRWNIQRGVAVIPKSVHRDRLIENLNVFDFRLTDEEMKEISSLDMGYTGVRIKHLDPDYVKNSLKG